MITHREQAERHAIAHLLEVANSEASAAAVDLSTWCGTGEYTTESARDAAGLRALAGLEAVIGDLTTVFERLAGAVADIGDPQHNTP
ncbi:hypothetical protein [Nocardia yamanashiensis]|uniref:hypothetical protein n=1 Tax=Nocardia yamanashiensis TaxID=209247 RepID=UPI00082BFBEE|nr:hypothetical protein [Nocardia yamanashiensis]